METTLSGRAKDYSFVTDGERKEKGANAPSQIKKKQTYTQQDTGPRGDCDSSDSYIVLVVRGIQN